jgi:hypothetical protein
MQSSLEVDEKFTLSWKFDGDSIDFIIDWGNEGWFGFGFCETVRLEYLYL